MPKKNGKKASNGKNGNGNGNGGGNGSKRPARRNMGGAVPRNVQLGLMNAQSNVRPVNQQTAIMKGSDFLTTIEVQPAPTTGQRILEELFISPSFFAGTRLTQMSQLWERYRFTSFRLRYVPAVPTTLACQLVVYFDTDPSDDPTSAADPETLIRQAVAHTGAQQWNFNLAKVIPLPQRADDEMYYTGDIKTNVRFSLQAKAFVIQVTDPLNYNGDPITSPVKAGSLFIDWVCKFQLPQINPAGFANRESVTYTMIFGSGESTPATPEVHNLTGLKPYKSYLVMASAPTYNPALPSGTVSFQPKLSVREDYLQGTYRASVAAGSLTSAEYFVACKSNAAGEIPGWVTGPSTPVTTISAIGFYAFPV